MVDNLKVGRRTSSRQASCLLLPLLSLLDRQILIYWFIYKFFYLFNQNRPILWWCNWCKHYRNQRYLLFGSINKSNVMLQLPFSSLLICYMFYMHFLCYQQSILFLLIVQTVWFHLELPRIFWDRIIWLLSLKNIIDLRSLISLVFYVNWQWSLKY